MVKNSKLRLARKSKNMKLKDLAIIRKTAITTVWKHEKDGIKTVRIAKEYAEILGCNWQELLD